MRGLFALVIAILVTLSTTHGAQAAESTYTIQPGDDKNWDALIYHMGLDWDDAERYILQWNPEIRNPYDLKVGWKLRVPGRSAQPAYPAYTLDYSRWVVIGTQTTKFIGSPSYRVDNIVNGANWVNNFFNDGRHPSVSPRDSLSLNWLLGSPTPDKGYTLGKAIAIENGVAVDIDAWGGGICQIPSTIFPALLKAGLDVTSRTNHIYYPYWWWGYPEGYGWDATISPPGSPDLVFRNMYDYPVRLWMTADRTAQTLRTDVYGPPELKAFKVLMEGPYFGGNLGQPTAGANWITGSSNTVLYQKVDVGGSVWEKPFKSFYSAAPYGH